MSPAEQKVYDDASPMYRGVYKRAVTTKSRAAAVHAKCLECCGWQRVEVANCTVQGCPLWRYRPYQKARP